MTRTSRLLLKIVRWFGGAERTEWTEAMQAETQAAGEGSTMWAVGCVWAATKDRIAREWRFVLAVLLLPIAAYAVQLVIFFPVVWLSYRLGLPRWTFIAADALVPLGLAFVFGRMHPGLRCYLALPVSFAIWVMAPLVVFWMSFGKSPFSWFGSNATWFMMPPLMGLSCAFLLWVAGAWLGSRARRRAPEAR